MVDFGGKTLLRTVRIGLSVLAVVVATGATWQSCSSRADLGEAQDSLADALDAGRASAQLVDDLKRELVAAKELAIRERESASRAQELLGEARGTIEDSRGRIAELESIVAQTVGFIDAGERRDRATQGELGYLGELITTGEDLTIQLSETLGDG